MSEPTEATALYVAAERLVRVATAIRENVAEFDTVTDGEYLDDLDKAMEQLDRALGRWVCPACDSMVCPGPADCAEDGPASSYVPMVECGTFKQEPVACDCNSPLPNDEPGHAATCPASELPVWTLPKSWTPEMVRIFNALTGEQVQKLLKAAAPAHPRAGDSPEAASDPVAEPRPQSRAEVTGPPPSAYWTDHRCGWETRCVLEDTHGGECHFDPEYEYDDQRGAPARDGHAATVPVVARAGESVLPSQESGSSPGLSAQAWAARFQAWHARECPTSVSSGGRFVCGIDGPGSAAPWLSGTTPERFVGKTCREVWRAELAAKQEGTDGRS